MAIDNTPPRLKLIITIAAITVVTLVSIDFALRSYYNFMTEQAQKEKMAAPKDLLAHRAQEEASLKGSQIPIEQAMSQIARGSRAEIIAPKPSDDLTPMTGWSKAPKPIPQAPAAPPKHAGHGLAAPPDHAALAPVPEKKPAPAPARDGGAR